jgi:hypothetical protein
MKNVPWFLVAALTIIIILLILFNRGDPKPELQKQAFETQIAILEAEKTEAKAQADSIISKQQSDTERIKVVLKSKEKQIQALKARVIVKRVFVQPLIDSLPTLKAFVEVQDSLIQSLEIQSDTLKHALLNQEKHFMGLVVAHQEERRFSERLVTESLARVDQLEKQNRKTKRQNKLLKIGVVVLPVAAVILMAQ